MNWAYGVTTVPERRDKELTLTLASLKEGGFPAPRLFVDGISHSEAVQWEQDFRLPITNRTLPKIRTVGNWCLALQELYQREPIADLFAIFQDDLTTYKNLRQYVERTLPRGQVYLNLFTFNTNEPVILNQKVGWVEAGLLVDAPIYHGKKQQTGRGAVALVLTREAVVTLLSAPTMVTKPQCNTRGWRRIDGAIVEAMNREGFREMIHNPSLVQHTGQKSTMGSKVHQQARSFRGKDFDALALLSR